MLFVEDHNRSSNCNFQSSARHALAALTRRSYVGRFASTYASAGNLGARDRVVWPKEISRVRQSSWRWIKGTKIHISVQRRVSGKRSERPEESTRGTRQ